MNKAVIFIVLVLIVGSLFVVAPLDTTVSDKVTSIVPEGSLVTSTTKSGAQFRVVHGHWEKITEGEITQVDLNYLNNPYQYIDTPHKGKSRFIVAAPIIITAEGATPEPATGTISPAEPAAASEPPASTASAEAPAPAPPAPPAPAPSAPPPAAVPPAAPAPPPGENIIGTPFYVNEYGEIFELRNNKYETPDSRALAAVNRDHQEEKEKAKEKAKAEKKAKEKKDGSPSSQPTSTPPAADSTKPEDLKIWDDLKAGKNTHREAHQRMDAYAENEKATARRLEVEAKKSEATVLTGMPPETKIKYKDKDYTYNSETNKWESGGTAVSSSELSHAVVEGTATVTAGGNNDQKQTAENQITAAKNSAQKAKQQKQKAQELKDKADALKWQGTWLEGMPYYNALVKGDWAGGELVGGIGIFASSLGKYRALSNALLPGVTEKWMEIANSKLLTIWADLPGFAAREACGYDEAKRAEEPGTSTSFVRTVGGSYQFVGSIQAEKSSTKVPLLCRQNPDPEAEEEFICSKKQVCVDDTYCHKDEDEDNEPDTAEPEKGFFYKITWGVTAPQDQEYTPYIDENGKAVRFNVQLVGESSGGEVWLYKRPDAVGPAVIALNNGESDSDVIVHYSSQQFSKACLRYDSRYRVKDYEGDTVQDQCVDFITSDKGTVEFQASAREESVTTDSGQVGTNADW